MTPEEFRLALDLRNRAKTNFSGVVASNNRVGSRTVKSFEVVADDGNGKFRHIAMFESRKDAHLMVDIIASHEKLLEEVARLRTIIEES